MNILVALGGNALLQRGEPLEASAQQKNIKQVVSIIKKVSGEHNVVITHGNGPQVGLLALQNLNYKETNPYPLDVLGAESAGMIGYMIIQELSNQLGLDKQIANVLTRTIVDPKDPAFANPTKFIGPVYSKEDAEAMQKKYNWSIKADGDFFRRVVPSPLPKDIVEINTIKKLIDNNTMVVCGGGGGVPVMQEGEKYTGVEAVVDKDLASCLIAEKLKIDALVILTDVDAVAKDFGQPTQKSIKNLSIDDIAEFNFPAGSMGPKIDATANFVRATNASAYIGQLKDLDSIIKGEAGTRISTDPTSYY